MEIEKLRSAKNRKGYSYQRIADESEKLGNAVSLSTVKRVFAPGADPSGFSPVTLHAIAQVLGVSVRENFIRPYFSRNIAEYWRRWQISMGTWFKDYIWTW